MGSWDAPAQRVFRQTLSTVEVASLHTVGLLNRSDGSNLQPARQPGLYFEIKRLSRNRDRTLATLSSHQTKW